MFRLAKVVQRASLIGIVLAVLAVNPCGAVTAEELLSEGHAAVARGDLAAAKDLFGKCLSQYPQTLQAAEASWKLGYIAIKEGNLALAEQRFSWVVDNHPSSPKAPDSLLRLAYLAKKAGRPDALNRFLEVTLRYPDTPEAQLAKFRLARLQTGIGELDLACENFKSVKENPKAAIEVRAEAAALEGMAHLQKWYKTGDEKELEQAIMILESVQDQFPKETKGVAWSRFRLGLFFLHEGRNVKDERLRNNPARGRAILQDAIAKLPHNYFTWWMKTELATGYIPEGRYADVVEACKALLAEEPPASWKAYIMYVLGDCQIRVGDKQEAAATLRRLIEEFPKVDWADAARGRLRDISEF